MINFKHKPTWLPKEGCFPESGCDGVCKPHTDKGLTIVRELCCCTWRGVRLNVLLDVAGEQLGLLHKGRSGEPGERPGRKRALAFPLSGEETSCEAGLEAGAMLQRGSPMGWSPRELVRPLTDYKPKPRMGRSGSHWFCFVEGFLCAA